MEKCVLITGAAKRIGRATALRFAEAGYQVCIHYRHSRDEALTLQEEIRNSGGSAYLFCADLQSDEELEAMFAGLREQGLFPDLMILNASSFREGTLTNISPQIWDEVMDVNLRSVWYTSILFRQLGGRRILIIGDASANTQKHRSLYALSRKMLRLLAEGLAKDLPEMYINLVEPKYLLKDTSVSQEFWKARAKSGALESYLDMLIREAETDHTGRILRP